MLTPSKVRRDFSNVRYDFSLRPGEAKEQYSQTGKYTIRAARSSNGASVTIFKKFAANNNFYINKVITYQQYVQELNKPINHGSLIEAF